MEQYIDYVIMNQRDRRMCLDVIVKRGAECNTDHQFLHMKIRFAGGCYKGKGTVGSSGAWKV